MNSIISVSIHAPVKGATAAIAKLAQMDKVSIHAPVKGATIFEIADSIGQLLFQSTLP